MYETNALTDEAKPLTDEANALTDEPNVLGPVARILVSANRWLRGIKTYRFPWYLTPVSANHTSNNPGLTDKTNVLTDEVDALTVSCKLLTDD